jgi:plastocyanin
MRASYRSVRQRTLALSVAGALVAAVAVVPGMAAGSAPTSASFTATDFAWNASGGTATRVTIAHGGTVAFSYPSGHSEHDADFAGGPRPTSCTQTSGPSSGAIPPLPRHPTSAAWSGTCTFSTPGTYTFHCDLHPFMHGTIVVQGSGGSPFAGPRSRAISIHSRQRGTSVHGSVRLSSAATGGRLEIVLRASARSLGRRGNGKVRVGRLISSELKPGVARFAVSLGAAGRRAERTLGMLAITVHVIVEPPGFPSVSGIRQVLLRP